MRIEEPQLLAAMDRIERVVDVERDPFRDLPEGFAIKSIMAGHAQQGASVGQVLQTEMVDCEHSSRRIGDKSSAILNMDRREDWRRRCRLRSLPQSSEVGNG